MSNQTDPKDSAGLTQQSNVAEEKTPVDSLFGQPREGVNYPDAELSEGKAEDAKEPSEDAAKSPEAVQESSGEEGWKSQIPKEFKGDLKKFRGSYDETRKAYTQIAQEKAALEAKIAEIKDQNPGMTKKDEADVRRALAEMFSNDDEFVDFLSKEPRVNWQKAVNIANESPEGYDVFRKNAERYAQERQSKIAEEQKRQQEFMNRSIQSEIEYVKLRYPDEDWENTKLLEAIRDELNADDRLHLETAYHKAKDKIAKPEAPKIFGAGKGKPPAEGAKLTDAERIQVQIHESLGRPRGFGPGL